MSVTKSEHSRSLLVWVAILLPCTFGIGFALFIVFSHIIISPTDFQDRETSLFISWLENKDESIRVAAIGELCKPEHRSNSVLGLMYDKLADGSSREKQAVILGLYDYLPARQYIVEAVDDSDTEVREIANAALAGDFHKK